MEPNMEIGKRSDLMADALRQCVKAMEVALLNVAPHSPRLGLSLAIVHATQVIKLHERSVELPLDSELPQ